MNDKEKLKEACELLRLTMEKPSVDVNKKMGADVFDFYTKAEPPKTLRAVF